MKRVPDWLWPAACAAVPFVAAHLAWRISTSQGFIPDCIPHFEGCTSISRAARQGDANLVFKSLMLPAALVYIASWAAAARWIERLAGSRDAARGLVPLGIVAGVAVGIYASFLGTEGAAYGWLRRYGITFYFAATFCAMLVFVRQLRRLRPESPLGGPMVWTQLAMLLLGLSNVVAPLFGMDTDLRERVRDAMEWQLGCLFSLWFAFQARLMR